MKRLLRTALLGAVFAATAVAALLTAPLSAAGPEPNLKSALVTLAPITGTRNVEMAAQIFDLAVAEAGDSTFLTGVLTFKLHNTDKLMPATMLVGFPAWGGGAAEWNDRSLTQFAVTLDGDPVTLQPLTQSLKIGNETRTVRWLTFPMTLTEDDRGTVEVRLRQNLGDGLLPTVAMAQAPAINWTNYVGSARFTVRFPALTTPEQFRVVAPAGSAFDGRALTWLFSEYNPAPPLVLQLIKPRLWREMMQARTALAQNADPKAALALGGLFAQLARVSQSPADLAQATAAYQRAAELDTASVAGPLELARLYESRLRGEFGAVADADGMHAAALEQWRAVLKRNPANAEARDATAQHAFALAQSARRGGLFAGALDMLEIVRGANSSKITKAQLDAEVRAANAGLVAQRMDAGQWADALQMISAEAVGPEAQSERSALQARFNNLQASVTMAGDEEVVSIHAMPFPGPSDAHRALLLDYVSRIQPASAEVTADGDSYVLTARLPARPLATGDLPATPELALLRDLLAPPVLGVTRRADPFTTKEQLEGRYNLAEAQRVAREKLSEVERALAALAAPSGDETQEAVRRVRVRALEQYRAAWQSLGSTSSARIVWQAEGGAPAQLWDLSIGQSREVSGERITYETGAIAAVTCLSAGGFGLVLTGIWLWLTRRRARRGEASDQI